MSKTMATHSLTLRSNYIVFRTHNSKLPSNLASLKLRTGNNILKRMSNVRFWGIVVDEHLSWKPHIAAKN